MFDWQANAIRVNTRYVACLILWHHHNALNDDGRLDIDYCTVVPVS